MADRSRRSLRRKSLLDSLPVLQEELFAYQEPGDDALEALIVFHRWTGLIGDRHLLSISYFGPLAGPGLHKNARRVDPSSARINNLFDQNAAWMQKRGIVIDEDTARGHLERLAGHRDYHCNKCGAVLPIGAAFCPTARGDKPRTSTGCGTPVPALPATEPATP